MMAVLGTEECGGIRSAQTLYSRPGRDVGGGAEASSLAGHDSRAGLGQCLYFMLGKKQ